MTARRSLFALGAGALAVGAAACALDFSRFEPDGGLEPVDATTRPDADVSMESGPDDAAADVTIVPIGDADTIDGGADAGALSDGQPDAPCTPSPSCIMSAQRCAAGCVGTEQQCRTMCASPSCRANCTRTEGTCITQCQFTCSSCTRSAGCSAAAACADAAP